MNLKKAESILKETEDDLFLWIRDLAKEAESYNPADITEYGDDQPRLEFRLYLRPKGNLSFCTGLSDYDQDHRGWCGAGSAWPGMTQKEARAMAEDVISQILDVVADDCASGDDDDE